MLGITKFWEGIEDLASEILTGCVPVNSAGVVTQVVSKLGTSSTLGKYSDEINVVFYRIHC